MYTIYIRDAFLNRVGEVTDFKQLQLIPRFNDVGTFQLDLPTNTVASSLLNQRQAGIIVVKDGQTIFSGQVTSRKRSFSGSGDVMTFSGKDDNNYLFRALAYPETNGYFGNQAYDFREGNAETIMKQYVDYNIGGNAQSSRKQLAIEPDAGQGKLIVGFARFDNLLELLQSLATRGGGLGFRVIQVGQNLQFQVYQPTDKTSSAVFSPLLGNLASFEYSDDDPECNLVVVGGSGTGTSRQIDWKADNTSIVQFGRVETFVDKQSSDTSDLSQACDEELTNKAEKISLTFTPIDTPSLQYIRDYNLGDRVSVVLTQPNQIVQMNAINPKTITKQQGFDTIRDVVRQVSIAITPDGVKVSPIVGTQDSNNKAAFGIFAKMKNMVSRISKLERV